MIFWLLYYAWAFGFTYVVCQSLVTLPLRLALKNAGNWDEDTEIPEDAAAWASELLDCPACVAFHIGWISGVFLHPLNPSPGNPLIDWGHWVGRLGSAFVMSFATAGAVLFLQRISRLSKE